MINKDMSYSEALSILCDAYAKLPKEKADIVNRDYESVINEIIDKDLNEGPMRMTSDHYIPFLLEKHYPDLCD